MTVKKNDKGKDYIDLTVNVGETANAIFLMSGNYYFCDNPILDSKDLTPEGAPLVEQTVTIPYSGTKTVFFDQSCTVYTAKGPLSNAVGCPPVNININQKPVIDQINPKNPALPSGDNQYVSGNTFDIAVTTVDADGDLTQCTATIKTPKGQLLTSVSDAFTINAQHQLQLPAEKFIPFGKYPGSVTCTDDKGAMSAAADFVLMTTDAYASLFLPADEGAGSIVKDWSKNSLVGQLMAGAGWIAGVNGSAINFPGKGPTVEFAANPAFSFGAAPFTIATWVFMNPPNGAHTIFANSDYTGYKFGFSPSNAISFYSYGCSSFVSGGGLGMATWGHVALTRYGNKFSLYTNGALVGSATCADDYKIAEKFWIGCDATGPKCVQPLNGAVDEVVFVGRALSSAEILAQCKLYDPTGSTCVGP